MKFKLVISVGLLLVVMALLLPAPLLADFTVVSMAPGEGTTNVATDITFEITFSAAVDTNARFAWPEEFCLGLLLSPSEAFGDPDSVIWSADKKTVRIYNLKLQDDTKYIFAVLDARNQTGEYLLQPKVVTFTTGTNLPIAHVSGTVSYSGGDIQRTTVALYEAVGDIDPVALATLDEANQFTLKFVPDGGFYPIAVYDINHSGSVDPEPSIDLMGLWDLEPDGWADIIEIKNGQSLSGLNITLFSSIKIKARQRYAEIEARAKVWNPDAGLQVIIPTEMREDGRAGFWIYQFFSPAYKTYFSYVAIDKILAPFGGGPILGDEDTPFLPDNWLDSDVIADSAEANGGADFRLNHADAFILAGLGTFDISEQFFHPDDRVANTHLGLKAFRQNAADMHGLRKYIALNDTVTAWDIMYQSEEDHTAIEFIIDAVTGKLIREFSMGPSTALDNLTAAEQEIQNWSADAYLVMIGNHANPVDIGGKAYWWFFIYYSPTLNENMAVFVMSGFVQGMQPPGWEQIYTKPLGTFIIDSDQALAVAEANGGADFRAQHNDMVQINCYLAAGLFPESPDKPVWQINYISDGDQRTLFVDAQTGNILTHATRDIPMKTPDTHALMQNYPNPFNPQTHIRFRLAHPGFVEMDIYNLNGERVTTLLGEFRTAGLHSVMWDGTDAGGKSVAGGVYLCRMKMGDFQASKKMLLLR
ncbi:PepSY domain-containing protein [candidate division KSB1 bacterium]|nr:PepSY domain-containing protein [candidate division KSB1 bacterium]